MIDLSEQNIICDFTKILEKVGKFKKRLEQTVPVSICEDVYRTLNRVDVLKKNMDKLLEHQSNVNKEYEIIRRKIWFAKKTLSLIIGPATASVVIIAVYLALLTIILTNLAFTAENGVSETAFPAVANYIYRLLRENPLNYLITLSAGGVSIFILIVIAGFAYGKIYRRVNVKGMKADEKRIAEKMSNIRVRIEALKRRYEKDTSQLVKLHEIHPCICYKELNTLYSTLEMIEKKIISLKNAEDKKSVLVHVKDLIAQLRDEKVLCSTPVTDEFRVEIYVDPDLIRALEELINEEKIDWDKYIDSFIKFRFSTSPLTYGVPIINSLKNAIS